MDSSVALIKDGEIKYFIDEERLNRIKHFGGYPELAIKEALNHEGIELSDVAHVGIVDRPYFRLLKRAVSWYLPKIFTYPGNAIYHMFHDEIPSFLDFMNAKRKLLEQSNGKTQVHFIDHHMCHMASAFLVSPFEEAAILTMDAQGEVTTTVLGIGKGRRLKKLQQAVWPHSLGLFYGGMTDYLGFRSGFDEYKVMGLASYGKPTYLEELRDLIRFDKNKLLRTNLSYFNYQNGKGYMSDKFFKTFGHPRKYSDPITKHHKDIAASAQALTEEIVIDLAGHLKDISGMDKICMAGGVALNCVANGKLAQKGLYEDIFIQPASGDNGGSLGAAYFLYNSMLNKPRSYVMETANLGSSFTNERIESALRISKLKYRKADDICKETAKCLSEGKIVGWFQGKMESGPRALGSRSILADPTDPEMKNKINKYVKFREEFRPFAPSVKSEWSAKMFHTDYDSPFMLLIVDVKDEYKAKLPAITHVDGTARIQSVKRDIEPRYWKLLDEFEKINGLPILLNTSFNVMGEPIVCTPEEAIRCFYGSGIDVLAIGDFIIEKEMGGRADGVTVKAVTCVASA